MPPKNNMCRIANLLVDISGHYPHALLDHTKHMTATQEASSHTHLHNHTPYFPSISLHELDTCINHLSNELRKKYITRE